MEILIIGGGYVGLPLALLAAKKGHKTFLFDKSEKRCHELLLGKSNISTEINSDLQDELRGNNLTILSSIVSLKNRDAKLKIIVICVPTPLDANRIPDLSMVKEATATAVSLAFKDHW